MLYRYWTALGLFAILVFPIDAFAIPSSTDRSDIESSRNLEGGYAVAKLNRAQQAYYLESNGRFSRTIQALDTGVPRLTANYLHWLKLSRSSPLHYAITYRQNLKSYVGRVILTVTLNGEATTSSITCESETFGRIVPPTPLIDNELKLACAPGTQEWTTDANATPEELNNQGKTTVASMNRAQQAYFLENEKFSTTLIELGLGIGGASSKRAYDYTVQPSDQFTFQYGISRRNDVKSYVGAVVLGLINEGTINQEQTTFSVLCENIQLGPLRPASPIVLSNNQAPVCAPGTQTVPR